MHRTRPVRRGTRLTGMRTEVRDESGALLPDLTSFHGLAPSSSSRWRGHDEDGARPWHRWVLPSLIAPT